MTLDLRQELGRFGAPSQDVYLLSESTAENIDYLDLINQPRLKFVRPLSVPVDAVIESSGQAIAYVVRADNLATASEKRPETLKKLRHDLACRGDAEYLLVWRPGELEVFSIGLSRDAPRGISVIEADNPLLLQQLSNGTFDRHKDTVQRAVHSVLFDVLSEVSDALTASPALSNCVDDVISLIGRALFARFLIDRGIINSDTYPDIFAGGHPEQCFDNPQLAALTCDWLHDKFNGEMLPLATANYQEYFGNLHDVDPKALGHLSKILHRAPGGQLSFELYWDTVNFAHVPVGLLSQVYEHYAHKLFAKGAKEESIYYTPRFIAEFIVNEAFNGIEKKTRPSARVLDPAVGAGIFLVLAFRRLVAETWEATNTRPDYRTIRRILKEQIFGFDINASALRMTSLSLYLTALELDPNPFPPSKLKFHKLLDTNLFVTRGDGEEYPKTTVLGSLGPGAPEGHDGLYSLVLGNPPWTAWKASADGKLINAYVSAMTRGVALQAGDSEILRRAAKEYTNPDFVPDLPFVWRAMRWAKPGGMIAFALHGRLLFKRTDKGKEARDTLFSALRVLAILNGSEHADGFWPGVNQPFCLLFAQNSTPRETDTFLFLTPDPDTNLIPQGRFRIDYQTAEPVQLSVMRENSSLLKTLAVGSALDADVSRRLSHLINPSRCETQGANPTSQRTFQRFGDYWRPEAKLEYGQGFRVAEKQKQNSALFIQEMGARELSKAIAESRCPGFLVQQGKLPRFDHETVESPRRSEIYHPPLVLVSEAPGASRENVRARLVLDSTPVAYTESFYGFSTQKHPKGEQVARYAFVLFNSSLFIFYTLITSAKFGAERRALLEEDILDFPVLPFESLTLKEIEVAHRLSDALIGRPSEQDWDDIESWVYNLYGLDGDHRRVVADTLATRLPYSAVRRNATKAPTKEIAQNYLQVLEEEMKPLFALAGTAIHCQLAPTQNPPWIFFDVFVDSKKLARSSTLHVSEVVSALADNQGATRIFINSEDGRLRVGILAQRRYWTHSRARLLALDLINRFSGHLMSSVQ